MNFKDIEQIAATAFTELNRAAHEAGVGVSHFEMGADTWELVVVATDPYQRITIGGLTKQFRQVK